MLIRSSQAKWVKIDETVLTHYPKVGLPSLTVERLNPATWIQAPLVKAVTEAESPLVNCRFPKSP
jgi:hypothetical protein